MLGAAEPSTTALAAEALAPAPAATPINCCPDRAARLVVGVAATAGLTSDWLSLSRPPYHADDSAIHLGISGPLIMND